MNRWIIGGAAMAAVTAAAMGGAAYSTREPAAEVSFVSNEQVREPSLRAVGLTSDQRLVSLRVDRPGEVRTIGKVSGLRSDSSLVGIDYRVQDGKLYGVGDAGGVYTLSTKNANATKVSQLTVALSGTSFGVDFNPAADRLRIVSDNGQNLRHNVNAGGTTIADTTLSSPTGVTAVAYTNNDLDDTTATALYDVDTAADQVSLQAPANSGQLSPIGKLGVDTTATAGFDIHSKVRGGRAVAATGFATLSVGGRSTLYKISLITGRADKIGRFPRDRQVTDLALPLDQR